MKTKTPSIISFKGNIKVLGAYFSRATHLHTHIQVFFQLTNGTHTFWNQVAFSLRAPIQIFHFVHNVFTTPCQNSWTGVNMWLKEYFLIFTQQIKYLFDDSLIILILPCICCLMSQSLPSILRVHSYHSKIFPSFQLKHWTCLLNFLFLSL